MIIKLIDLLIILQCFVYKNSGFGPSLDLGLTVSPDRLVFIVILGISLWRLRSGEIRITRRRKVECYMLLFAVVCTMSAFVMGAGSWVLYYLFDFNYNPFIVFILTKSIPHDRRKLES